MIFFDLDGTLLDDETAVARGLDALHARYGATIGVEREALGHVWLELLDRYFPRFLAGEMSMDDQRRARMRDLFHAGKSLDDEQCDAAFAVYLDAYERGWSLYPDVSAALAQLSDHRLGVISNGNNEQQLKKLDCTGLASRFSVVVISGECGFAKPDRRISLEACRRAEVQPRSAIFIGDDWAKDIVGSRDAGLQPIWLRRGRAAAQEILPGVPIIETLKDLAAALLATQLLTAE